MDISKLLQCERCKKDLDEFMVLYGVVDKGQILALENFAVFMELRRLKANQRPPITINRDGIFDSPFNKDPYKITC
jgi:hypothetical protein